MGLFKRFKEPKPTPEELKGFKYRLKYGDDPAEHWKLQREHWDKYKEHKDAAYELLRKIYKVEEVSKYGHYSQLEVWGWTRDTCKESPIGQHVYMHEFGEKNPKKGESICLACGKDLRI